MNINKTELVKPSAEYLDSYLSACREYKDLGLSQYRLNDPDDYKTWGPGFFQSMEDESRGINLKEGYVPASTFWLVDTENKIFIGEGNIRHELSPFLMCFGGHIGYAVRATLWNKGFGTLMLSMLLTEAAKLGIDYALITCNEENLASRRIIEKNGGEHQDTIDNIIDGKARRTRRYWVLTSG